MRIAQPEGAAFSDLVRVAQALRASAPKAPLAPPGGKAAIGLSVGLLAVPDLWQRSSHWGECLAVRRSLKPQCSLREPQVAPLGIRPTQPTDNPIAGSTCAVKHWALSRRAEPSVKTEGDSMGPLGELYLTRE